MYSAQACNEKRIIAGFFITKRAIKNQKHPEKYKKNTSRKNILINCQQQHNIFIYKILISSKHYKKQT